MFRDAYRGRRKREKPNSMRLQPTISFRCSLDGETLGYLRSLKNGKIRSQFINQAISMKYFHDRYHKGFILQLIDIKERVLKAQSYRSNTGEYITIIHN